MNHKNLTLYLALGSRLLSRAAQSFLLSIVLICSAVLLPQAAISAADELSAPTTTINTAANFQELIEIPQYLKDDIDRSVRPIKNKDDQVDALHSLLFSRMAYGITYQNDYTKTARQVLSTGSGNCLSLASLFIGSTRYLGLKAHFQAVQTPTQWSHANQMNILFGHVNVIVNNRNSKAVVEFLDTYTADTVSRFPSKKISDNELLARYYNNRGAELMGKGQVGEAVTILTQAITVAPKFSDVWLNYGVAKKLTGELTTAEQAYQNAYRLNDENISALNNLTALYKERGETTKADALAPKIRRHQMKNPYFLAQLSVKEMQQGGDLGAAQKLIDKAIDIHPEEPDFFTQRGKVYFRLGRLEDSAAAFKTAIAMTNDPALLEQRKQKFEALNRIMAQR